MVPILIGGCERSGTTMLGSLLGRAPKTIVLPENRAKLDFIDMVGKGRSAEEALRVLRHSHKWNHLSISDQAFTERFDQLSDQTTPLAKMNALVQLHASSVGREDALQFWVDHKPNNAKFCFLLSQHYPTAKFIHIVRDGRAVANSVMKLDWGPSDIITAADWWIHAVAVGLASGSQLSESRYIQVSYEDLILDPAQQLRRLCAFTGQTYTDDMLEGDSSFLRSYTKSQHALVGGKVDTSRIDKWKQEMSPGQVSLFERQAYWMLSNLGYTIHTQPQEMTSGLPISTPIRLLESAKGFFASKMNKYKKRRRIVKHS